MPDILAMLLNAIGMSITSKEGAYEAAPLGAGVSFWGLTGSEWLAIISLVFTVILFVLRVYANYLQIKKLRMDTKQKEREGD